MRKHVNEVPLDDDEKYLSNDIDVATMLICKGYTLEDIKLLTNKKATFVFKNHPAIKDAVDGFWSNRIWEWSLQVTVNMHQALVMSH